MHIKKGDKVIVTTGKDKGKSGSVLRALPKEGKVVVEGINIKNVLNRRRAEGKAMERKEKAYPISASNVKLAK